MAPLPRGLLLKEKAMAKRSINADAASALPAPPLAAGDLGLSTDQVAAFVELARSGSLRSAAVTLGITEQGVRNRLLILERRLGVELYRKSRGPRRSTPLTVQGHALLPAALAFLSHGAALAEAAGGKANLAEVNIAASHYLISYLLIDATLHFRAAQPGVRVTLHARTEQEIESSLRSDPELACGFAAVYEASPDLVYRDLFAMGWSAVLPKRHRLARRGELRLAELAGEPLLIYERGSTGRQHIVEAFAQAGAPLAAEMEVTNTDLLVRMVEAGLGVSIVPLLPSGAVTRGRRVEVRPIADPIRAIHSGLLTRRGERLPPLAAAFVESVRQVLAG